MVSDIPWGSWKVSPGIRRDHCNAVPPEDYCKHQMRLLGKAHSTTRSHYTSVIMVVPIITIEPEEPALLTKNQGGGEGS